MGHMGVARRVVATALCWAVLGCGSGDDGGGDGGGGPSPSPAPVATVSVSPGDTTLLMEHQAGLRVVLRDSLGNVLTGRAIAWSTTSTATVPVSASGIVTGLALGNATITATSEGQSGSVQVHVIPRVVIWPDLPSLFPGDTILLTARLETASGLPAGAAAVTWTSADLGLGTVASNGVATGVATGVVRVTAAAAGASAGVDLAVVRRPETTTRKIAWMYDDGTVPPLGMAFNEVWVADNDGSNAVRVSAFGDYPIEYSWSPDGSRLAVQYIPNSGTGRALLVAINADGSGEVPLGIGGVRARWSPDGRQIAYRDGAGDLRVVNSDGSNLRNISSGGAADELDPEWSPDGRLLVYKRQPAWCDELWVVRPDGTGRRRITIPTGACDPRFSPDGKWIAYMSATFPPTGSGAWLVSPWGGNATPISANCSPNGSCGSPPYYYPGDWLSDGYRVLVRGGPGSEPLTTYDVRTGVATPVPLPVEGTRVCGWSPDQSMILYTFTETDGRSRVGRMTSAGTDLTPVSAAGRHAGCATWQPSP